MEADDSDSINLGGTTAERPITGGLRLVSLHGITVKSRRRAPRRRDVVQILVDRRRAERRKAKPGIDGLLRTVLADDWK